MFVSPNSRGASHSWTRGPRSINVKKEGSNSRLVFWDTDLNHLTRLNYSVTFSETAQERLKREISLSVYVCEWFNPEKQDWLFDIYTSSHPSAQC